MSKRELASALRLAVQCGDLAAIDDLLRQADAQGQELADDAARTEPPERNP
jgi:hypothetical protein